MRRPVIPLFHIGKRKINTNSNKLEVLLFLLTEDIDKYRYHNRNEAKNSLLLWLSILVIFFLLHTVIVLSFPALAPDVLDNKYKLYLADI